MNVPLQKYNDENECEMCFWSGVYAALGDELPNNAIWVGLYWYLWGRLVYKVENEISGTLFKTSILLLAWGILRTLIIWRSLLYREARNIFGFCNWKNISSLDLSLFRRDNIKYTALESFSLTPHTHCCTGGCALCFTLFPSIFSDTNKSLIRCLIHFIKLSVPLILKKKCFPRFWINKSICAVFREGYTMTCNMYGVYEMCYTACIVLAACLHMGCEKRWVLA